MVTGYQREIDVTMSLAMDAVKGSEVRSDSFVIPISSKTGEKILTWVLPRTGVFISGVAFSVFK